MEPEPKMYAQRPINRSEPKPLPLISSNLSYSAYLRYQDLNTGSISKKKHTKQSNSNDNRNRNKRAHNKRPITPRETIESYKDDNIVVIRDNVVKSGSDSMNANNLNPFHNEFNKVIENPFLKAQEMSLTTEITEDHTEITDISDNTSMFEINRNETINSAIVDLYDSNEGCDPFLKMRVSLFTYFYFLNQSFQNVMFHHLFLSVLLVMSVNLKLRKIQNFPNASTNILMHLKVIVLKYLCN